MAAQPVDALFQPLQAVAQLREPRGAFLEFGALNQQRPFFRRVLDHGLRDSLRRVGMPGNRTAHHAGDPVRSGIAEHLGELLLRIPSQVAEQEHHFAGEARIALDLNRAQQVLLAFHRRRERARAERDDKGRWRFLFPPGPGDRQAAVGRNVEAQRRQGRRAQFQRLPGEGRQPLARPRLGLEQMIQRGGDG